MLAAMFTGYMFIMPPQQYDHAYSGRMTVHRMPWAQIVAKCGAGTVGCSVGAKGRCIVWIATDSVVPQATILRHERAHCNGWSPDHRGGTWVGM